MITKKLFGVFFLLFSACGLGDASTSSEGETQRIVQDDAGTGTDLSADLQSPFEIGYGEVNGIITSDDDGDAYGFKFVPGDHIMIKVVPTKELDTDIFVALYSDYYSDFNINEALRGAPEAVTFAIDSYSSGKKIGVLVTGTGDGAYTLFISKKNQNDGNSGLDAPANSTDPLLIQTGFFETNFVGGGDDLDFFSVGIPVGKTISVTISPEEELDVAFTKYLCTYTDDQCILGADIKINDSFKGGDESLSFLNDFGVELQFKFGVSIVGDTSGTYKLTVTIN